MEHTITIDCNQYTVNPDDQPVREGDKVTWTTSPSGADFTIDFDETPFEEGNQFGKKKNNGKVKKGAHKKPHKYTVTVNGRVIDPRIIVN